MEMSIETMNHPAIEWSFFHIDDFWEGIYWGPFHWESPPLGITH
jgi:hypothetical protein